MKTIKFLPVFLLLFLVISINAQDSFKAKVTGVVDGDTITVLTKENTQKTIRLLGIDAPEKDQEFGDKSKQFLSNLVLEKTVSVVGFQKDCTGQYVAVISYNNKDLSLSVAESGFAWSYNSCEKEQISGSDNYNAAILNAKQALIGLWSLPNPIQPSEFRRIKKEQQEKSQAQTVTTPERIIIATPLVTTSNSSNSDSGDGKAKTVRVKGYTKADGTVVNSYDRRAPSKKP